MGTLDGKVAIVSGSGRGIGREIALKLGVRGRRRRGQRPRRRARAARPSATSRPPAARPSPASVRSPRTDFAERFVDTAVDAFGGLDIIVNNAGYTWDTVIQKMTDEQWDTILDVHLKAPFRILRAAQPFIKAEPDRLPPQGRQHLVGRGCLRQCRTGQLRRGEGRA